MTRIKAWFLKRRASRAIWSDAKTRFAPLGTRHPGFIRYVAERTVSEIYLSRAAIQGALKDHRKELELENAELKERLDKFETNIARGIPKTEY